MRKYLVQAAIAAAIASVASTAANAAAYTIHISGASAQRTFWEEDLSQLTGNVFQTIPNSYCTLIKTSPTLSPQVPDLHSATCTVQAVAGAHLPAGINEGDTITLNYEAEFGSVWGIAPFVTGTNAQITGRRSVTNAVVTGYSRDLDTATAGLSAPSPIDIGVSDMEPIYWALPDNWSVSDGQSNVPNGTGTNHVMNILSIPGTGQPSLAQLQAMETGAGGFPRWKEVNGEVFSVVVNNTAAPTNAITNLSTQSLRAILTGQYSTWNQVPEATGIAGNNVPIVVCRRDHGSGTQVATSLYFTQTECGGNNGTSASGGATGGPPRIVSTPQSASGTNPGQLSQTIGAFEGLPFQVNPIESFSTNDIQSCLNAYPGEAIGIRSLASADTYTTLNIDNVQANAHNAALGVYKYAVITWAVDNSANTNSANGSAIAGQLIKDAVLVANGALPTEAGTLTNGVWGGGGQSVVFGIQDTGAFTNTANPEPSIAAITANPSVPVAIWKTTQGSMCTIPLNHNNP